MIAASNDIAQRYGALASTGVLKVPSNASTNTVASDVTFTLDIRHPQDEVVHVVQTECLQSFAAIAAQDGQGATYDWRLDTDSPSIYFDKVCIESIKTAAGHVVGAGKWVEMASGGPR